MSRPKYYWYGNVKKMVNRYPLLKAEGEMEKKYIEAIKKALNTTKSLDNGDARIKAIELVYFKKSHTVYGVASELHYSERTIFRWLNGFIYMVGRNVGF